MTVGLPLIHQCELLIIPSTIPINMDVFVVKTSLLYNGYNGMSTESSPPAKSTQPPFVTFLTLGELISYTTNKLGLFFYAAWRGSHFLVATNQAPHTQKPTLSSWLSITHIESYTLTMNM